LFHGKQKMRGARKCVCRRYFSVVFGLLEEAEPFSILAGP
jgi:hypothetical protein